MPTVQNKRGTAANLTLANPTPAAGEVIYETDTRRWKLGDGTTAWNSLAYGAGTVITGNKGDITVSGAGETWTINADAVVTADIANANVTYAKIQNVSATDRLLGRSTAGAGVVEEIVCTAFGRSLLAAADSAAASATLAAAPTASPTFTGVSSFAVGSAAAPAVCFTGDTDTGVAQIGGANSLSLVVGGVEGARLTAARNLVLGTASFADVGPRANFLITTGYIGRQGVNGTAAGNTFNFWWVGNAAQLWIDTTNVGNITISSDYRIKADVETQTSAALPRIAAIRPVTYTYNNNPQFKWQADGVLREGFIAHELAEVIPSAVDGEKDAPNQIQSLRLDALCAVLVKAVQEQQAIISSLEQRINALEAAAE